jgi:hypothetical protein
MLMMKKRSILGLILILLSIIFTACGPSPEELTATAAAAATSTFTITTVPSATPIPPSATPTSIPTKPPTPTMEPLPGSMPEGILVTFKYKCDFSGPTELSPGEYTFILIDDGKVNGSLYVTNLIPGKTTQDLLNHPNMKDGTWWSAALDILEDTKIVDAWRNESRGELYFTYYLKQGEHVLYRGSTNPHFQWYCGSISVK